MFIDRERAMLSPRLLTAILAVLAAAVPAAQAVTYRNPAHPIGEGQVVLGLYGERIERDTEVGSAPSRDSEFHQTGISADYGLLPGGALGLAASAVAFTPDPDAPAIAGDTTLDGAEAGLVYRHNLNAGQPFAGTAPFSRVHFGVLVSVQRGSVENPEHRLVYTRGDVAFGGATPLGGPFALYGGVVASELRGTQTEKGLNLESVVDAESNAGLFAGVELFAGRSLLGGLEIHGGSDMGLALYALFVL